MNRAGLIAVAVISVPCAVVALRAWITSAPSLARAEVPSSSNVATRGPAGSPLVPVRAGKHIGSGLPTGSHVQVSFLTNGFSFASFFKPGEKWVGARLTDHVPGVVPPPRSIWTWSTSFEVLDVAGRGTDLLVVLGAARNGETVIERWDITVPTGAPTAVLPRAAAVVGTPVVSQAPLLGVQGGTPIPPLQRPAPQQPVRTEVYRGPSLGTDMEIEVDPDGRFVLVLARDPGVLYRVLLTENASTDVVFDTTASPSLGSVIALQTFRHDTLGRQVAGRIKGGAPLSRVVLFDFDNDGVFDLVEEMTMQDCANFGLPQAWVEDYTNYSGVLAPYQW